MFKYIFLLTAFLSLNAADFTGWEGLRVLPIEGGVSASDIGDVDGSGRESLFIANRRQSRIDIYNWLAPGERKKVEKSDSPNELPFAKDFERKEIILERPPFDILLENLDDDKNKELVVLTTLPLTLHLYKLNKEEWSVKNSWKLPNERLQSLSMLSYKNSILVSTDKGVLVQELVKGKPSVWMKPKESNIRRLNWWMHDVDRDGHDDLVDLIIGSSDRAQFRWSKRSAGKFLPAIPLGDIEGTNGRLDTSADEPTFFIQNPIRSNTINEYTLEKGEESLVGMNRILPVLSTREEQRTSIRIDGKNCLVEVDPARPTMRVSKLTDDGFTDLGHFPILRKTKAVVAPQNKSFLLMQVGDSPDLYISHWLNGRFTYPKQYLKSEGKEESKLLGFGIHGSTTWWIKTVGSNLFLNTLSSKDEKPSVVEFKGIGKGLENAFWLGGSSLMIRKKYAKSASFYMLKSGKPEVFQAAHLKDAVESQFRFIDRAGKLAAARIVDGIIQWYGAELQPIDQVMLDNGGKIIDVAFVGKNLLVLDSTGELVHQFETDKSGLMKETKTF